MILVSCPPPQSSKNPLNCDPSLNMIKRGNQCDCAPGYRRQTSAGNLVCVAEPGFCGAGATLDANNKCRCTNGNTYVRSSNNPCGGNSSGRVGLSITELQNACQGVGQWSNGFCACGNGKQFNAVSRRCEAITYHHTNTMCGSGAKFYGQGGRGVCICNTEGH
ncbi:MAG: hypothetical protein OYH77_08900, partial [Pseudomonadota bacterium]|nr:hypothetical protein [Pseudomonadota bacterium]